MNKLFAVLLSFFVFNSALFAQDAYLSLEKTGSGGSDKFLSRNIVSEKEIENKNTPAMLALISAVPGVFVTKAASGIKSDAGIRGIGDSFRKIGLFIDGRPETVSVYGCAVSQTLLSGNIGSVEVIKTPDSVLYGGDALGGLVKVTTKKPQKPFEGEVSASYGTYNTQRYFVNIGGLSDRIMYQFSANKASSDGYLKNSGYNADDYYLKFAYKIDDVSEIIAGGKYFAGDELEPGTAPFGGVTGLAAREYNFKRGGADVKYKRNFISGDMEVLFFGDFGEHEFSDGFHSKDSTYGIFAHFTDESVENNTLKYGAEYRLSDGKVIAAAAPPAMMPRGEWKKSEFAVFALDEYALTSKAKILAGARYNYDEISGDSFVPRAGAHYSFSEKITARLTYSRGFRAPYINELYTTPPRNPGLKPETQDNYEIGVNSKYFETDFDVSAFVINGDNIIRTVFAPGRIPVAQEFRNSGSYVFKGMEFSVKKEIIDGLKVFAGYSYLDPGDLTQGIVKNKIDLSADYRISRFDFSVGGMLAFDYHAGDNNAAKFSDFNVFNAKAVYNFTDVFSVFAAADNFTDQKYRMFIVSFGQAAIYEMPGATYTLGAKYKF
ncbi:MAG: TonB-dependent receptor [Endomicrobium sp.]|jgi:iron complex outermembrane receptor protein|nr:TonB-dependent receptor [Endomicrobium sp.]